MEYLLCQDNNITELNLTNCENLNELENGEKDDDGNIKLKYDDGVNIIGGKQALTTATPAAEPTEAPTQEPTKAPLNTETPLSTESPSANETLTPSPTAITTPEPTSVPTETPTEVPSNVPDTPSAEPSSEPTATVVPTAKPTTKPTSTTTTKISASIWVDGYYVKDLDDKKFSMYEDTDSDGKLKYKSSNKKVVTVTSSGIVNIKGCGEAGITISVAATKKYKAVSKKVKILILPASVKNFKVKAASKGKIKCTWKKTSAGNTTCQIQYSLNKQFKNAKTFSGKSSLKSGRYTGKGLKKGKYYYFRIKAVAKTGGKSYSGKWSRIIKVKVK